MNKLAIPGEYFLAKNPVFANEGRRIARVTAKNTGDRPIQVGSHTHFFEVNKALDFERKKAFGFRLNIPAGTAIRFEPGDTKEVELVELGGKKIVFGFNGLVNGRLDSENLQKKALRNAKLRHFKGS